MTSISSSGNKVCSQNTSGHTNKHILDKRISLESVAFKGLRITLITLIGIVASIFFTISDMNFNSEIQIKGQGKTEDSITLDEAMNFALEVTNTSKDTIKTTIKTEY